MKERFFMEFANFPMDLLQAINLGGPPFRSDRLQAPLRQDLEFFQDTSAGDNHGLIALAIRSGATAGR
jgi:hypothetical protein